MQKNFLETALRDVDYPINEKNKELINNIFEKSTQDIEYVWTKIPVLKESLKHVKGYVAISNAKNKIKITYDKETVSKEIANEFYDICQKWENKYKIDLDYDVMKEVFYIS